MQDDGFIAKILVKEGEKDSSVGTPLLVMVEDEESVAAFSDYQPSESGSSTAKPDPKGSKEEAAASDAPEPGKHPRSAPFIQCIHYVILQSVHG